MVLKGALFFGVFAAFLVVGSVNAHDHSSAGHGQGQRSQKQDVGLFKIAGVDQVSKNPFAGRRWGSDTAQHDRKQRHLRPMWAEVEESQRSQEKDDGEIPAQRISSRLLKAPGVTLTWGPGNNVQDDLHHFRNQRHLRPIWVKTKRSQRVQDKDAGDIVADSTRTGGWILKDPLGAMRWGGNIQNFRFQYRNRRHLRPM